MRAHGNPSFIYLRFCQSYCKSNDHHHNFVIRLDFLLTCVFWVNLGWSGSIGPDSIMVDGRKLNSIDDLRYIVYKIRYKIKKNLLAKSWLPLVMSHEIIVKKSINLSKFAL